MDWHWDERKARANLAKHGVSFALAELIFDDPFHQTAPDGHADDDRWKTIGLVNATTLMVVHTVFEDDGGGRIISARKATTRERRIYEQGS